LPQAPFCDKGKGGKNEGREKERKGLEKKGRKKKKGKHSPSINFRLQPSL